MLVYCFLKFPAKVMNDVRNRTFTFLKKWTSSDGYEMRKRIGDALSEEWCEVKKVVSHFLHK